MDARLNTLHELIREVTGQSVYALDLPVVRGAGGGSSKSGSGSSSSTPDTLFSTATIRLVDLIGEGEIVGVRGGLKGVYLNDIPVQNADNSFNFKGVTAEFRNGTPDQAYMAGYPDVQTPKSVGVRVLQTAPVIASISEAEATRVRVTLQFPALFLSKSDGTVNNNTVQYRVEVRYSGGPWVNQIGDQTLTGKTTSGYFKSHDLSLPVNGAGASAPWQVRVTRISADTDDFNNRQSKYTNQSDIIFYSTTSITDAKFTYGDSAVVGLTAQASLFGSSVPGRTYLVDGAIIGVPSNYDPVARSYSGVWDGTFKQAFANNPAWILYDMLLNDRFGLGDAVDAASIDKWSLYEIGRYCDVSVSDGKGGSEPRFVFNGVISTQQEAFELLQLIAQVFQGFNYWSSGTVTATQDRPADPVLLVTEANVENGEISYSSSGRRARHTMALVAWNDPSNLYKQEIEPVEATELDASFIARYGYNPVRVDVLGCTSRGQAHRAGLWKLFTELYQTQIATYTAGLDHAVARPGDVVAVQDPQIANIDVSGRLLAGSTATNLLLDRPVTLASGNTYKVSAVLPDGTVKEGTVNTSTTGTVSVLPLSSGLGVDPDPAAVWVLAGPVKPQQFRIVSIREEEPHKYAVTAIQHEPTKYAVIDAGAKFEAAAYSTFPTTVAAPANVSFREGTYTDLGQPKQSLTVSWTAGDALTTSGYYVTAVRPSGTIIDLPKRTSATADFLDAEIGTWKFFITAYGLNGKTSVATQATYTVVGWAGQQPTTVANLQVLTGGSTFGGRSCTLAWANVLDANTSPYPVRNAVAVYDASTNALLHKELLATGQTQWTYDYQVNLNEGGPRRSFRVAVTAFSATGAEGPPTSLAVSNPAPAAIVPTLSATSENVFVSLPKVNDLDFAGYLVWVSTTSGFTPTDANVTADDSGTFQSFKGATNTTYYVRVAAYDAFSKAAAGLNISAEYSVTCTATAFDNTPPAVPTGLSVASNTVDIGSDGTVTSRVQINWTAVTSSNLGKYEVAYAPGNNPADSAFLAGTFVSSNTALRPGLVPGQQYTAKVRSISTNGFGVSAWSTPLVFTAAANAVAPDPVTNLAVSSAFQNAFLSWTNPANTDLGLVEIWAGATNALGSATKIATVAAPGNSFTDNTLGTVASRYYWARSVNTSKVPAGSYAGPVLATSAAIQNAQIAPGAVDATKFAAGITPVEILGSLPTSGNFDGRQVFLTTDKKLYRYSVAAGAFVKSVDGADIVANSITAGQIQAGAIGADQIAANAITTSKLAITSQNLAYNADGNQGTLGIAATAPSGINYGVGQDRQAPEGMFRTYLYVVNDLPAGQGIRIDNKKYNTDGVLANYDVTAGQWYELAACFAGNTNQNYVQLLWLNSSGSLISFNNGSVVGPAFQVGGRVDIYNRSKVIAQAPSGAVTVIVAGYCSQASGAAVSPFVIGWSGWMFASARAGQTEVSPYVDWNNTVINGGYLIAGSVNASKITAGSITTDRMTAGTINADRLVAQSITTSLLATDVLTANNIKVGTGSLTGLFAGNNVGTTISGGAITTNSITAQILRVNARGVSTRGINFAMQRDGTGALTNVVTWSAGFVSYTDNNGNSAEQAIAAGSASTANAQLWVYWTLGSGSFSTTTSFTTANGADNAVMAGSSAGNDVQVFYGGVVVDGSKISALSVDAAQIRAGAITAGKIAANAVTAGTIAADAVVATNIAAGAVTAKHITISDNSNMVLNGDFGGFGPASMDGWPTYDGSPDTAGGDDPGGYHRFVSSAFNQAYSNYISGQSGEVIYFSAMVYNASNGAARLQAITETATGTVLGYPVVATSAASANAWVRLEGQVTLPASCNRFRVLLYNDRPTSGATGLVYWGKIQVHKAAGGTLIVDGSIQARHITATTITADKLAIGISAPNLVWNSDSFVPNYLLVGTTDGSPVSAVNQQNSSWGLPGMYSSAIYMSAPAANTVGFMYFQTPALDGSKTIRLPVQPGQRYEYSAYLSCHRCTGQLNLEFADVNGNGLAAVPNGSNVGNAIGPTQKSGAPDPSWRSGGFTTAPPNAVYIQFRVLALNRTGGDAYVFASGMYLAAVSAGASVLSPWSAQSQTIISGGAIATGSITAATGAIADLTITNAKIDNLTLGNEKIQDFAVTNGNGTTSSGGTKTASITLNVRRANSRVVIMLQRSGNPGVSHNFNTDAGNLQCRVTPPGGSATLIRDYAANYVVVYTSGSNTSVKQLMPSADTFVYTAPSAGSYTFQVTDTNNASAASGGTYTGTVSITVVELSK